VSKLGKKIIADLKEGKKYEKLFMDRLFASGVECSRSTKMQDIYDHIDVMDENGRTYDVKGYKGDRFVWLEFMNVRGNKGWMKGRATHIAFYLNEKFYVVNRQELLKWAEENLPNIPPQYDKSKFYTPYRRKGRRDILIKVKVEDVTKHAIQIL